MNQPACPASSCLVILAALGSWALAAAGDPGTAPAAVALAEGASAVALDSPRVASTRRADAPLAGPALTAVASPVVSPVASPLASAVASAVGTPAWAIGAQIPMGLGAAALAPARVAITAAPGATGRVAEVTVCRLGADDPGAQADPLGCTWLSVALDRAAGPDAGAGLLGAAPIPPGDYGALRVRMTGAPGAPSPASVTLPMHHALAAGDRVELRLGLTGPGPTLAYVGPPESAAALAGVVGEASASGPRSESLSGTLASI